MMRNTIFLKIRAIQFMKIFQINNSYIRFIWSGCERVFSNYFCCTVSGLLAGRRFWTALLFYTLSGFPDDAFYTSIPALRKLSIGAKQNWRMGFDLGRSVWTPWTRYHQIVDYVKVFQKSQEWHMQFFQFIPCGLHE